MKCLILTLLFFQTIGSTRLTDGIKWKFNGGAKETKRSVWTSFAEIAASTGATNLGQGFPDWQPPSFVLDALYSTLNSSSHSVHQYARPAGLPELVKVIGNEYSKHLNREIDPMKEVAITVGATQGLYLSLLSILRKDDEVILFEPSFDLYAKQIKLTGAKPVYVPLGNDNVPASKDPCALDVGRLERSINRNTRIIVLNTPHNPTGKVFSLKEMQEIATIVKKNPNVIVIADEVYKHAIYDPLEPGDGTVVGHYHFARLPDMWDRTITLSSSGKTYSITGWQVGWLVGPARFIEPIQELLPCVQFCASTPLQQALCKIIPEAEQPYQNYSSYHEFMRQEYKQKREILEVGLRAADMEPLPSSGGIFVMARLPTLAECTAVERRLLGLELSIEKSSENSSDSDLPYDWRYCTMLAKTGQVMGIPASPFFHDNFDRSSASSTLSGDRRPRRVPLARFAFCKLDKTMKDAQMRLIEWSRFRKK